MLNSKCSCMPCKYSWNLEKVGQDGQESACSAGDLGWKDPLKEGMAAQSSILAWRSPHGQRSLDCGPQSMGLQSQAQLSN